MEKLIPVINNLQDVFGTIGYQSMIDLPQIVVVGSQSSGKSSVLESIVGRDFLPRGSGVVTRRPLVLQLFTTKSSGEKEGEEWGEFLHLPGNKFFDFSEIRLEIQRETDRVTGKNKGISNKSINLKIFSPHVLNLTLVDLPGITRVPTGDQPENIEELIRTMCEEFITNPNAIILAVSAANQDLVNSDGLKLARSVDPDGVRTIGVLSKVDIMDNGTDCTDILNNRGPIPLRKGYIAIKNRSQRDIQNNMSVRDGLKEEEDFFKAHPQYGSFISKCGTRNLSKTLNQILMLHINECLPQIKSRITNLLSNITKDMESLGEGFGDNNSNMKGATLLRILSQYSLNFNNNVDGKAASTAIEMTELYGGARINYIFNEIFAKKIRSLDPFDGLSDEDIRTTIANATGTRPSLFVNEVAFDLLIRKQISKLESPGLQCVELVQDEMCRIMKQSESLELTRFPPLREHLMETANRLLINRVSPTQKMIVNLIEMEKALINTSHPDFIGGKAAVTAAQQSKKLQPNNVSIPPSPAPIGAAESKNNFETPTNMDAKKPGGGFQVFNPPASVSIRQRPLPTTPIQSYSMFDEKVVRLAEVPDKMYPNAIISDREKVETEIIKTLILSYFDIVKKNYTDLVPKTIMFFLVNQYKENLQNELVSDMYREPLMSELLQEAGDVASKRQALREKRDLLFRAVEIVNK
eukprot:gene14828-19921_t